MKLRDYQVNLIKKTQEAFKNNKQCVILVAPTGSGKTVTCAEFARVILDKNETIYFIVHRIELLRQAELTFKKLGVSRIKCFMIQTLANKIEQYPEPNFLIIDECHHATSKMYQKIIQYYRKSNVLGVTATPCRLAGNPLGELFEQIIEETTASELIKQGFLSDYDYYCPKIETDYTGIKSQAGDLNVTDCFNIMNKSKIYGDIISNYKKYCINRRTIIYATTIEHSMRVVAEFNLAGFNAVHLDGNTSQQDREQIDIDFKSGKYDILSNCSLISEGYDIPDCDCVILLRRTLSLSLYIQMATRCLRPQQNKHAVILDFTGSVFIHGLPTIDRKWSLTVSKKTTNINAEPDILARTCNKCLKTYAGLNRICPFCENDNGLTRKQIQTEKDAELIRIENTNKIIEKNNLKKASNSLASLIEFGKLKNYKAGWAYNRWLILQKYKKK